MVERKNVVCLDVNQLYRIIRKRRNDINCSSLKAAPRCSHLYVFKKKIYFRFRSIYVKQPTLREISACQRCLCVGELTILDSQISISLR